MEIWSPESGAFIDFADGYSYLPIIPNSFGVKRETIPPVDLSIVLHEFTHQLALKGPFGWICAFFQTLRSIAKDITGLSIQLDWGQQYFQFPEDLRNQKLAGYFTANFSDIVANYQDIVDAYRPFLEGIALFVQLDFQPSRTHEYGSELFFFMRELIATEFLGSPSLDDVFAYFEEAHTATIDSDLVELVFGNDPKANSYFVGYTIVKEIQRILSVVDSRLADPEIYFVFLHNYLFYDSSLVDLCVVERVNDYQRLIKEHLTKVIGGLVASNKNNIQTAVDSICQFQNAEIGPEHWDFAALIRDGERFAWTDQVVQVRRKLRDFTFNQLWLPDIRDAFQSGRIDISQILIIFEEAVQLFRILINIMPTFKFRHSKLAILSYKYSDKGVMLTSVDLFSGVIRFSPPIAAQKLEGLLNKIDEGEYVFAEDDPRLKVLPMDAEKFNEVLSSYVEQGKLLILEDYDMYLIVGRERCKHLVLEDFTYSEPYWKRDQGSTVLPFRSEQSVQLLDIIGPNIHYETYFPLIKLYQFMEQPIDRIDKQFISEIHRLLWQNVFKDCQAPPEDVDTLITQKIKVIAARENSEEPLLHRLLRNQDVDLTTSQYEISEINRRWRDYTGNNLINIDGKLTI